MTKKNKKLKSKFKVGQKVYYVGDSPELKGKSGIVKYAYDNDYYSVAFHGTEGTYGCSGKKLTSAVNTGSSWMHESI